MSSSTEVGGFPFERLSDAELATLLEVSPANIAGQRGELARRQRDPAAIAGALDALPAATVALLGLMLARGGVILAPVLHQLARERYRLTVGDVRAAIQPAMRALLVVPILTPGGQDGFGLIQPAGELLAPLVDGLDLPELPAEAFVPGEAGARNPRTFLATCMATRHVDVRLTNEGRPHRTAVKRLAKQLAIEADLVDEILFLGWGTGVLRLDDDVLRPDDPVIAAATGGRYPGSAVVTLARTRLARGPVDAHALALWLIRRHDLPGPMALSEDSFALLPGFATGTIDGGAVVAQAAPTGGGAAGHVTPSFEVMLPPESRLIDVVQVGACCEWERLDRAIVGRITKLAVTRALAAGGSAPQLLAHLAAASRHPVPQNVEAAIRDWASSLTAASVATGHVIVVDVGARDRGAAALGEWAARELAPGVFVVALEHSLRDIRTALLRAGVTARDLPEPSAGDAEPAPAPRDEVAASNPAAARVRARVVAWQRGVPFEGQRDDFLERARARAPAAEASAESVEQQLARWGERTGVRVADHEAIYPALLSVLGTLDQAHRTAVLARCQDLPALLRMLSGPPDEPPAPRRSQRRVERRPPPLLWQTVDLRPAIEAAAAAGKSLALELGGEPVYLKVERLLRRGQAWMVLGEDVVDREPLAIPLDEIGAVAALPDNLAAYDLGGDDDEEEGDQAGPPARTGGSAAPPSSRGARRPWRPEAGQPAPAGHVPCPCGSGERYRNCCRNTASA